MAGLDDGVEPIHAQSFFTVPLAGPIIQVMSFDYYDPKGYYVKLLHKPASYRSEMLRLIGNMQEVLNDETIILNGQITKPKVFTASLDHRGIKDIATITFFIELPCRLREGINIYENLYEPGEVEYDYEVYWVFPPKSRVIKVEASGKYEVLKGRLLIMWARKGDKYGGKEIIRFLLKNR